MVDGWLLFYRHDGTRDTNRANNRVGQGSIGVAYAGSAINLYLGIHFGDEPHTGAELRVLSSDTLRSPVRWPQGSGEAKYGTRTGRIIGVIRGKYGTRTGRIMVDGWLLFYRHDGTRA